MSRSRSLLWITAVVIAGTIALGVIGWRAVARRWLRLRPGPTLVLDIDAAHPFDDGVTPADTRRRTRDALHSRLETLAPTAIATFDGDRVQIVLPRSAAPEAVVRQLTRPGRLEFKIVDDGSEYMRLLAPRVVAQPPHDVEAGLDGWTEKDS